MTTAFVAECRLVLSLGGMDARDKIILKDFVRNQMYGRSDGTRFVTISDRVVQLGYGVQSNKVLSAIGGAVANLYRHRNRDNPTKRGQFVDGGDRGVNNYTTDDLPIMDDGIHAYFAARERMRPSLFPID